MQILEARRHIRPYACDAVKQPLLRHSGFIFVSPQSHFISFYPLSISVYILMPPLVKVKPEHVEVGRQ